MHRPGKSDFRARAVMAAAAVLLVAACSATPPATTSPATPSSSVPAQSVSPTATPAGPPRSVTIVAISSSFITSASIHLAEYLGYYAEENLQVTVIPSFEGASPEVALVEGQIDLLVGDPEILARRLLEDPEFPVMCVATLQMWGFRVMVPTASDIEVAADLEGKIVGVPDVSDATTLGLMLNMAGVDPTTVESIPTGGRAPMALEMFEGATAASMGSAVDQLAIEREYGKDSIRRIETMPLGTVNGCVLVRKDMFEQERDVVVRMLRAIAKGATVQYEDTDLAVKLIGQQYDEAYDDLDAAIELAAAQAAVHGAAYEARWEFPEETWQDLIDRFAEVGFLPEEVTVTDNIDFSLLDDVWDFDQQEVLQEAAAALEE